jgi:diguanylate cyclase (GGDEF)-like protein
MADAESPRTVPAELVTDDPVTGLPLRESIERITAQALTDQQTTGGALSLLVIEVDADPAMWRSPTPGHRRRVFRWIARELQKATRTSDFIARTAENQFMALLPGSSARQAESIMARLQSALSRQVAARASVDVAAGLMRMAVVTAPEDGGTVVELFRSAERACARAPASARTNRAS